MRLPASFWRSAADDKCFYIMRGEKRRTEVLETSVGFGLEISIDLVFGDLNGKVLASYA